MASTNFSVDRLDSWKDIAGYLHCDVRTAIRWEKTRGLPIHRMPGGQRQPVYAYRHEIDLWFQKTGASGLADAPAPAGPEPEPDTLLHAQPNSLALHAGIGSRWLTGKEAVALVVVCVLFFAAFALRQTPSELTVGNPTRITRSQTRILSPLLSDGAQIFYPRYENGRYSVAAVPAKGGESATVVTSIANPEICDMTPDGKAMLLRNLIHSRDDEEPLYVQSIGGQAQRVGDILAYDAAWTPDAKRIIYSAGGVVYSTNLTGKSRRQLFSGRWLTLGMLTMVLVAACI